LFNFVSFLHYFLHAPKVGNHELATLLGEVAVLIAFGVLAYGRIRTQSTSSPISGRELLAKFGPPIRLIAIPVYFFAFFHKLNAEYLLDRTQSCGALLPAAILESFPQSYPESLDRVAPNAFFAFVTIWGSLAIEGAIPIFLMIRRFNLLGVCLGFAFH